MRLIDADELKKCAIPCEIHNGASTDLCVPLYQIDNAPTVERPQGECISREALKKALHSFFDGKVIDEPTYILRDVLCHIDSAPVVDPRIEYGTDGQPYRLFMSGGQAVPDMLQGWRYEERPQGEWITFPTSRLIMQCPKCTAFLSRTRSDIFKDSIGEMNFCPNCGADMRGDCDNPPMEYFENGGI